MNTDTPLPVRSSVVSRESGLWIPSCVLGVLVIIVAQMMSAAFPSEGAGCPPGFGPPVFAFEMAQSADDLEKIFGTPDDPKRAERIAAMDHGNRLDYLFMIVYGSYLAAFFRAVAVVTSSRRWLVIAALGLLAAVADGVENAILLGLTADLQAAPHIAWLAVPVWFKFFCLMACAVAAGRFLFTRPGIGWKLCGAAAAVGGLTVPAAFIAPETWGFTIGNGLAIGWIAQLAWSVRSVLRRSADT